MTDSVSPAPSATVVMVRDHEETLQVLMLQKNTGINFGGSWVFPGGVVDQEDYHQARETFGNDEIEATTRIAACRETAEETGLNLNADQLHPFAHWVTPAIQPKRYATWFFIADASGQNSEVKIDEGEIVQAQWFCPQQALNEHLEGNIQLNAPSFVTLGELAGCAGKEQALSMYHNREMNLFLPRAMKGEGFFATLYQSDSAYQLISEDGVVSDAEAILNSPAPRHRLYMPKTGAWNYIDER